MFRDTSHPSQDLLSQGAPTPSPTSDFRAPKKKGSDRAQKPPRRPRTLLDRSQLHRAKAMLKAGAYAEHVAKEIGVPSSTFRRWLSDKESPWREGLTRRERNQLRILNQARAEGIMGHLRELLDGGKGWTKHARWLETVNRKEWGRKPNRTGTQ